MKKFKKLTALMLAMVMALAMSVTAFAQTVTCSGGEATITINNAAKGETYTIYKLFDATVSSDNSKIAYSGDIPTELEDYFEKDSAGNVIPKASILNSDGTTKMTDELKGALEDWAKSDNVKETASAESDGSTLEFTQLPYGYYVMTTTHKSDKKEGEEEAKSAITVTSTQPDASIYDKNVSTGNASKEANGESYSIGDTITYTATFNTTNYLGEEEGAKQVVKYVISDTLPSFLSSVKITSITIDGEQYPETGSTPDFGENKSIEITWATKNADGIYTSVYKQGAKIEIIYEAVLTGTVNINGANTNTISIQPYVDGQQGPEPWGEPWKDTEEITTYGAAIMKVDQDNNPLDGATFKIAGLMVKEVKEEGVEHTGIYKVVSYNSESEELSDELFTNGEGKLYILGLAKDEELTVTEFKAPDGYNKLTETKTLKPQVLEHKIIESSGDRYYDEDGNLVSESSEETTTVDEKKNVEELETEAALTITNQKGTLLPSTGGIGTTIFYVIGAILVIGAGVILVAKKRMSNE